MGNDYEAGKGYDQIEQFQREGFSIILGLVIGSIVGYNFLDNYKKSKEESNQTDKKEA